MSGITWPQEAGRWGLKVWDLDVSERLPGKGGWRRSETGAVGPAKHIKRIDGACCTDS